MVKNIPTWFKSRFYAHFFFINFYEILYLNYYIKKQGKYTNIYDSKAELKKRYCGSI